MRLVGTAHAPSGRKVTMDREFTRLVSMAIPMGENRFEAALRCLLTRRDRGAAFLGCWVWIVTLLPNEVLYEGVLVEDCAGKRVILNEAGDVLATE